MQRDCLFVSALRTFDGAHGGEHVQQGPLRHGGGGAALPLERPAVDAGPLRAGPAAGLRREMRRPTSDQRKFGDPMSSRSA